MTPASAMSNTEHHAANGIARALKLQNGPPFITSTKNLQLIHIRIAACELQTHQEE